MHHPDVLQQFPELTKAVHTCHAATGLAHGAHELEVVGKQGVERIEVAVAPRAI
jgi:hypothetical protein